MDKKNILNHELSIKFNNRDANIWACLLLSFITTIINILSTTYLNNSSTTTVFIVFIGILIIMYAIYRYGMLGVFVALISSVFFCMSTKASIVESIFNVCGNVFQALVVWAILKKTKTSKILAKEELLTNYKLSLLILGILYVIFSFIFNRKIIFYIFIAVLIIDIAFFSMREKSMSKFRFFLLVSLLPSFVGSTINSIFAIIYGIKTFSNWYNIFSTWLFANTILFSTFGYLLLSFLQKHINIFDKIIGTNIKHTFNINLKFSTVLFYIATLFWNMLFYIMHLLKWINHNEILYLFPWVVGNIFFIINLWFSRKQEAHTISSLDETFNWLEKRTVVAEKNTQMLLAIIAFLLPLYADFLGVVTKSMALVFIFNITTAVVAIGLIWVPKNNICAMSLIKDLKTIFHLYTVSLLLLGVVMIICEIV
ncbi:MAG: hypothetical protein J1F32_03880 [Erysipelotrichales bacterium]|nr:hypothetical protein [Erysipelotrichales bacterium]